MAEKRITNDQLIEPGVFDPAIENAKKLSKELDDLLAGFIEILKASKELKNQIPFNDLGDIKKYNEAVKESEKTEQAILLVRKQKIQLDIETEKLKQQQIK